MINVTKNYMPDKEKYKKYVDEVYNIGGRNERTNLHIVDAICSILDEKVPPKTNSALSAQRSKVTKSW